MKHFDNFMRSWQERIAETQPQPAPRTEQQTANGRPLLPSEPESDMERDRRCGKDMPYDFRSLEVIK